MVTVAKACAGIAWCVNPCLVLYEQKDTTLRFLAPPGTDQHHPVQSPNGTPTRTNGAEQEECLWAGGSPISAPRWASFLAGSKHKGKQSAVAYATKAGHLIQVRPFAGDIMELSERIRNRRVVAARSPVPLLDDERARYLSFVEVSARPTSKTSAKRLAWHVCSVSYQYYTASEAWLAWQRGNGWRGKLPRENAWQVPRVHWMLKSTAEAFPRTGDFDQRFGYQATLDISGHIWVPPS